MKTVKPFSKTCYSGNLILDSSPVADNEREDRRRGESRRRERTRVSRWIRLEVQVPGRPKEVRATPACGCGARATIGFKGRPKTKLWSTYFRGRIRYDLIPLIYATLSRHSSWLPHAPLLSSGDALCSSPPSKSPTRGDAGNPFRLSTSASRTMVGMSRPSKRTRILPASTEDIEKDLHRSPLEYLAYQPEEGIDALRRLLRVFSLSSSETPFAISRR
jgi:TBC1 domain family member 8/9